MASQFYQDNYVRYKAGTRKVARWLYETAQNNGYQSIHAKVVPPTIGSQEPTVIELTTDAFTELAKVIASSTTKIVPVGIQLTFQDVIAARRVCMRFKQLTGEDDKGHAHFINVLVDIHTMFKPLVIDFGPSGTLPASSDDDSTADSWMDRATFGHFANRFEFLGLALDSAEELTTETSGEREREREVRHAERAHANTTEYRFREDPEMEFKLQVMRFMLLWLDTRKTYRKIWQRYAEGQISMVNATISAMTVMDISTCAGRDIFEEKVWSDKLDPSKAWEIVATVLTTKWPLSRDGGGDPDDDMLSNEWNDSVDNIIEATIVLQSFLERQGTNEGSEDPLQDPSIFPLTFDDVPAPENGLRTRYTESAQYLDDFVHLQSSCSRRMLSVIANSRVSCYLYDMIEKRRVTFASIQSWVHFMDAKQCLSENPSAPFESLTGVAKSLQNTNQRIIELHKDVVASKIQDDIDIWSNALRSTTQEIAFIHEISKVKSDEPSLPAEEPPTCLLARHPELCGVALIHLLYRWRSIEAVFCSLSAVLPALVFLYRAAAAKDAVGHWSDLETFMECFEDRLLRSEGMSYESAFKFLAIWLGVKLKTLVHLSKRRGPPARHQFAEVRTLRRPDTIFMALTNAMCHIFGFDDEDDDEYGERALKWIAGSHDVVKASVETLLSAEPRRIETTFEGRLEDVADAVCNHIKSQQRHLLLDFFGLEFRARELLRCIKEDAPALFGRVSDLPLEPGSPSKSYLEHVFQILKEGRTPQKGNARQVFKRPDLILIATDAIRRWIRRYGKAELESCKVLENRLHSRKASFSS